MTVRDILLLGDPRLYEVSEPVVKEELPTIQSTIQDLHDTMMEFRRKYGAGRAIAAPQIGVMKRIIYLHIDEPIVFTNPGLQDLSREMFEVWDDCMCFPELLVKVRRHKSCTIHYRDMNWNQETMSLEDSLSELMQHEYDHLDGVLAVSRAIDSKSFALRGQVKPGLVSG
ncbi:MAG: peptide deformylase [Candidatus Thorarchaeota archaeon]|jgi:peptide deformylase